MAVSVCVCVTLAQRECDARQHLQILPEAKAWPQFVEAQFCQVALGDLHQHSCKQDQHVNMRFGTHQAGKSGDVTLRALSRRTQPTAINLVLLHLHAYTFGQSLVRDHQPHVLLHLLF